MEMVIGENVEDKRSEKRIKESVPGDWGKIHVGANLQIQIAFLIITRNQITR